MTKHFAWGQAGDVVVLMHAAQAPSDADWDAYLAFVKTVRVPPERFRTLVFSDGGRPTVDQRKRLADLVRGRTSRVAIVTDASSIAFISAQLTLEGPSTKTFACNAFAAAAAHLGLSEAQRADVGALVIDLAAAVGGSNAARVALDI